MQDLYREVNSIFISIIVVNALEYKNSSRKDVYFFPDFLMPPPPAQKPNSN